MPQCAPLVFDGGRGGGLGNVMHRRYLQVLAAWVLQRRGTWDVREDDHLSLRRMLAPGLAGEATADLRTDRAACGPSGQGRFTLSAVSGNGSFSENCVFANELAELPPLRLPCGARAQLCVESSDRYRAFGNARRKTRGFAR